MNWYNKWFGTQYYDLLYNQRNDQEAQEFLEHLVRYLQPLINSRFLDLACGKGRHSVYLNSLGFDVTGIDLSETNISYCKKFENEKLHFHVHDMRRVFCTNVFDFVLNLFTSIGYFEHSYHNQLTINSAATALKPGGRLVIDFLNAYKAVNDLKPYQKIKIDKIEFEITKKHEDGFILKTIRVIDDNTEKFFYEKVQALTLDDFNVYIEKAGLKTISCFGNYQLKSFDKMNSERLIIIAEKNNT